LKFVVSGQLIRMSKNGKQRAMKVRVLALGSTFTGSVLLDPLLAMQLEIGADCVD
tara:strand:+ start:59 stop:223 length:165 start_codon:yes stop_codon:yes gene_type:complete